MITIVMIPTLVKCFQNFPLITIFYNAGTSPNKAKLTPPTKQKNKYNIIFAIVSSIPCNKMFNPKELMLFIE